MGLHKNWKPCGEHAGKTRYQNEITLQFTVRLYGGGDKSGPMGPIFDTLEDLNSYIDKIKEMDAVAMAAETEECKAAREAQARATREEVFFSSSTAAMGRSGKSGKSVPMIMLKELNQEPFQHSDVQTGRFAELRLASL